MSLAADVAMLKKDSSPETREAIATKVSMYFKAGVFDQKEEALACDIVRLLAKDVEMRVRKTLAENIKTIPNIPHDIAWVLSQDVVEVAIPILEFSKVLTEGDLIEIIRSARQVAKLVAISRRHGISESVSSALVHTRNEQVVISLCNNKTAHVSEESLNVVINQFRNNMPVIDSLVHRGGLPVGIVEKMIAFISGGLREQLVSQYKISEKDAEQATTAAREKATIDLLYEPAAMESVWVDPVEQMMMSKTEQLVRHLHRQERLTQSIILRALCEGNLRFFDASMSVLAGVPIMNARKLIRSKNKTALEALFKKAKLPVSSLNAVNVVIEFAINKENSGLDPGSFKQRLLEYIVSSGYDKEISLMPYIVAIIGSKVGTQDIVGG